MFKVSRSLTLELGFSKGNEIVQEYSYPLKNARALGVNYTVLAQLEQLLFSDGSSIVSKLFSALQPSEFTPNFTTTPLIGIFDVMKADGTEDTITAKINVATVETSMINANDVNNPANKTDYMYCNKIRLQSEAVAISSDNGTIVAIKRFSLATYLYPINDATYDSNNDKLTLDLGTTPNQVVIATYDFAMDRYVNPTYQLSDGSTILGVGNFENIVVNGLVEINFG